MLLLTSAETAMPARAPASEKNDIRGFQPTLQSIAALESKEGKEYPGKNY